MHSKWIAEKLESSFESQLKRFRVTCKTNEIPLKLGCIQIFCHCHLQLSNHFSEKKFFVITFLGSIIWIAAYSYLMVWWATVAGNTIGIPEAVRSTQIILRWQAKPFFLLGDGPDLFSGGNLSARLDHQRFSGQARQGRHGGQFLGGIQHLRRLCWVNFSNFFPDQILAEEISKAAKSHTRTYSTRAWTSNKSSLDGLLRPFIHVHVRPNFKR